MRLLKLAKSLNSKLAPGHTLIHQVKCVTSTIFTTDKDAHVHGKRPAAASRLNTSLLCKLFIVSMLLGTHLLSNAQEAAFTSDEHVGYIDRGRLLRQQGQIREAIGVLEQARGQATTPEQAWQAAGELGITLLQARRTAEAEPLLLDAHRQARGTERARYAVYLGNLALNRKRHEQSEIFYSEALRQASGDAEVYWTIALNRLRNLPEKEKTTRMTQLSAELTQAGEQPGLARYHLNLGHQATEFGKPLLKLAYTHIETARRLAGAVGNTRLNTEAVDALAQLYENRGRVPDALALTTQGITLAEKLPLAQRADLQISLEWRRGRLLKSQGEFGAALAAYRRATEQLEIARQDIPVEYEDGRSSYRSLFEPIYTTYVDLLLRQIDDQPPATAKTPLQQAVQTMELIRQTELQDFLGDRCAIEAVQGGTGRALPVGTAVLYPLILADRLELLLVSNQGIVRQKVAVSGPDLRDEATAYAASLRRGLTDTRGAARRLNDWLLAPVAEYLTQQHIEHLVVVPDGAIRLIPLAALHDGQHYAIEKYAISMVTGMSMTNTNTPAQKDVPALVAGLSSPGPVADKLGPLLAAQILNPDAEPGADSPVSRGLAQHAELRAIRNLDVRAKAGDHTAVEPTHETAHPLAEDVQTLRERLALPGVSEEVRGVSDILGGQSLLNEEFTINRFRQAVKSGDYRILHIASHGIFGGNAETSFIMAYDDVLNMHGLQELLKTEKFQKMPIELLSLSACQTAEGNDRAPLGISGAAIKARAKSVLGTLWPVEDNAAKSLMQKLYAGLSLPKQGKAQALRQAQLKLLHDPATQHPFFWAPFVLIGNWL